MVQFKGTDAYKCYMEIVALYDYSTISLIPWAKRGYKCFAYDIQHPEKEVVSKDNITMIRANLHDVNDVNKLVARHKGKVHFMCAFPVCTDLAVSGAPSFKQKLEKNPSFQKLAADHAVNCESIALQIGCSRFYIENPISILSTIWRKPDYYFHPYQYGRYVGKGPHPLYPDIIPDNDAYSKKTCLWCGVDFIFPEFKPVVPIFIKYNNKNYSSIHGKLGGKSQKTKQIRSCTPRGFSEAVFLANRITG